MHLVIQLFLLLSLEGVVVVRELRSSAIVMFSPNPRRYPVYVRNITHDIRNATMDFRFDSIPRMCVKRNHITKAQIHLLIHNPASRFVAFSSSSAYKYDISNPNLFFHHSRSPTPPHTPTYSALTHADAPMACSTRPYHAATASFPAMISFQASSPSMARRQAYTATSP